jgi:hypothetical protein
MSAEDARAACRTGADGKLYAHGSSTCLMYQALAG